MVLIRIFDFCMRLNLEFVGDPTSTSDIAKLVYISGEGGTLTLQAAFVELS